MGVDEQTKHGKHPKTAERRVVTWLVANWMALAALVIAVATFLNQSRPGNLELGMQRVAVSLIRSTRLVIPISFTNTGSNRLTVKDVVMRETFGDRVTTYAPSFSVKPDRVEHYLRGEWAHSTTPMEDREADFVPFSIVAGESATKYLVFNVYSGEPQFAAGRTVEYAAVANTSSGERSVAETITWEPDLEDVLQSGDAKVQVVREALRWRDRIAGPSANPTTFPRRAASAKPATVPTP